MSPQEVVIVEGMAVGEAEWLTCSDPRPMVSFLGTRASTRKLRLFGVACCRGAREPSPDWATLRALAVAERHADKLADDAELRRARTDAETRRGRRFDSLRLAAAMVCCRDLSSAISAVLDYVTEKARLPLPGDPAEIPWADPAWQASLQAARRATFPFFVSLCRDIFGNPFQPTRFDPAWVSSNGGVVRGVAQLIYDERRFEDTPILADALEDAGCDDDAILEHLRSPGPHTRGCCAVDLLLAQG